MLSWKIDFTQVSKTKSLVWQLPVPPVIGLEKQISVELFGTFEIIAYICSE